MELPRNKRLQEWRYGLRVSVLPDQNQVLNEVPIGIRNFVEQGGFDQTSFVLEIIDEMAELIPA